MLTAYIEDLSDNAKAWEAMAMEIVPKFGPNMYRSLMIKAILASRDDQQNDAEQQEKLAKFVPKVEVTSINLDDAASKRLH